MMSQMQSVLPEPAVSETMTTIPNVVPIVQQHGLVKQMSLVSSNNVEVRLLQTLVTAHEKQTIQFSFFLGEGYVGLTRCAEGLTCYTRSKWYAQCSASCPGADWVC